MERKPTINYIQDNIQHIKLQPTTSQSVINNHNIIPQGSSIVKKIEPISVKSDNKDKQQDSYQIKCNLLEYHIEEALLINKALRSELKQYKDKIEFEKKLRKFLLDKVESTGNTGVVDS